MFRLTTNRFLTEGMCKYEDEHGNRLFVKRNDDGFVAKLRFSDPSVKAQPLYVALPVKEGTKGQYLHIDYHDGSKKATPDVGDAIQGFMEIVNRWIKMLDAVTFMQINPEIVKKFNPKASEKDIANYKLMQIKEFEELIPAVSYISS